MTDLGSVVPRLDDVDFDRLVERAGALIPRFAPEWTDHNLHDPGMTIIDLLAWIVDQQVYRVGFVGGRHRTAFAALLGQRLEGPRPARGMIWPHRPLGREWRIASGTTVTCPQQVDLAVVTERDLYLTTAAIDHITQIAGDRELPISTGDGQGSWAVGGGAVALADTTLIVGFDRVLNSTDECAPISLGVEVAPPPGPAPTPEHPWGPIDVAYRVGAELWQTVNIEHDGTGGLSRSGVVILGIPGSGPGADASELRLRFDRGFFPVAPVLRALSVNVLPVVQLELERPTRLADGTNQPDQIVDLATTDLTEPPDRPDGPVLEIEVAGERWEQRPDFTDSGPADAHYVVEADHVRFGNGLNGRRPPLASAIAHTGLARTAASAGNVRRGLAWNVEVLASDGIEYGSNRQSLTGGTDATGIGDLVVAAREAATERRLALADDDLVAATRELAGLAVGRAEVLAGFDRRLPDRRIDDARTVVVVPARADTPPGYVAEVAARLEPRRALGERLLVQSPTVVPVDVRMQLVAEPGAEPARVEDAVEDAVRCRLAVLGRSEDIEPWPLGRTVTASELATLAVGVEGVATVVAVAPAEVAIPPDAVAVARRVDVEVLPAERMASRDRDRESEAEIGWRSSR